jgi:hypothetical protein
MRISKNISLGGKITDLNEIQRLASERKSLIVRMGGSYFVRPAAFIIGWPMNLILRTELYYSVKDSDITDIKFENQKL